METKKERAQKRKSQKIHLKKSQEATKVVGLRAAHIDQDKRKKQRNRSNDFLVQTTFKSNHNLLSTVRENMQKAIDHELKSGVVKQVTDFDQSSQKLTDLEYNRFRAVKLCRKFNRINSFRTMLRQGFPLTEKQIQKVFTVVSKFIKAREEKERENERKRKTNSSF